MNKKKSFTMKRVLTKGRQKVDGLVASTGYVDGGGNRHAMFTRTDSGLEQLSRDIGSDRVPLEAEDDETSVSNLQSGLDEIRERQLTPMP